jgi:hypothetical protein
MELHKRAFGLAVGLISSLALLLGTWGLIIQTTPEKIESRLSWILKGYSYTWGGAVIGALWLFVFGFIAGAVFALLYNMFSKMIYKSKG